MNAMNETSLTRAADPVSVFMVGALNTPEMGSVAHDGLEKGIAVSCNPDYSSGRSVVQGNPSTSEALTALVAGVVESPSDAAWRIISEWNLEKGYVSAESLERLSAVLHPEVSR